MRIRPAALFTAFLAAAPFAAIPAHAAAPTRPDLREELLAMAARDQALRQATTKVFKSKEEFEAWSRIDADNQKRLKEIVAGDGWPTVSMVGRDGADAAWLIAQHADDDPDFQRAVLRLLEPLTAQGEADPKSFAYLWDRTHYPQRFGTQGTCVSRTAWQPFEIEDAAGVDARRARLGLPPMADYAKRFDCTGPHVLLHDPADPRKTVPVPGAGSTKAQ